MIVVETGMGQSRARLLFKEKNNMKRIVVAAFIVLMASTAVFAETLQMQYVGPAGNNSNGEFTYPYEFTVNGTATELMCISLFNNVTPGQSWDANRVAVSSLWGTQDAPLYDAAAWLFLQEQNNNDPAINWAAWKLFYPEQDVSGVSGAQSWYDLAVSNVYTEGEFGDVSLYQPLDFVRGGSSPQEFLGFTPTPEPSTLLTLGSGIIGITAMVRRKLA